MAESRLKQLKSRLSGAISSHLIELVRLDVTPDLLRDLCARKRLRTADSRQRRAQGLLGENAFPCLLHRQGLRFF